MSDKDIFIAGAGIAGLIAAYALGRAGFSVTIADPMNARSAPDHRSTAFLNPATDFLKQLELWDQMAKFSTPLSSLQVADSTGSPPKITHSRVFRPQDIGADVFGQNLPNEKTKHVLRNAVDNLSNVTMLNGVGFRSMLTRTDHVVVRLDNGSKLKVALVIGADGRESNVRAAAGIEVDTMRYGQKALAFSVTHSKPHNGVSSEIYLQGGAFTTVPLPSKGNLNRSAIVWMVDGKDAVRLRSASDQTFNLELSERSTGILGDIARESEIGWFPVVTQLARNVVSERTVLIAEAAHVLPPIGAQGLNTSIQDIAVLVNVLSDQGTELGCAP